MTGGEGEKVAATGARIGGGSGARAVRKPREDMGGGCAWVKEYQNLSGAAMAKNLRRRQRQPPRFSSAAAGSGHPPEIKARRTTAGDCAERRKRNRRPARGDRC